MKTRAVAAAAFVAVCVAHRADHAAAATAGATNEAAVRVLECLTTGAAGGVAPARFSVSIETFAVKERADKSAMAGDLVSEAWRFTSTNVFTYSANAVVKTRAWAGMRDVCRALAAANSWN
jgi:hypothetical protein